jgi:hypothetical protein
LQMMMFPVWMFLRTCRRYEQKAHRRRGKKDYLNGLHGTVSVLIVGWSVIDERAWRKGPLAIPAATIAPARVELQQLHCQSALQISVAILLDRMLVENRLAPVRPKGHASPQGRARASGFAGWEPEKGAAGSVGAWFEARNYQGLARASAAARPAAA